MATASDFGSNLGTVGFVPFELVEGTHAIVHDVESEVTIVSDPTDTLGSGASQIVNQPAEYISISFMTDTMGATVHQNETSQEAVDTMPLVYKMRGWSTTLGQYVYWRSVGDPFVPAPSEYGNVINVTSELMA